MAMTKDTLYSQAPEPQVLTKIPVQTGNLAHESTIRKARIAEAYESPFVQELLIAIVDKQDSYLVDSNELDPQIAYERCRALHWLQGVVGGIALRLGDK